MNRELKYKPEIKVLDVNLVFPNNGQIAGIPKNPRLIDKEGEERCKASIVQDPEKMSLREMVVKRYTDGKGKEKYCVLMGNQRCKALKGLSKENPELFGKAPCKIVPDDMPLDVLGRWILKDNGEYGKWDYDMLYNEWNDEELDMMGLDMSGWQVKEQDFDTSQEIDVDTFDEEMSLKITLTKESMLYVKERLALVNADIKTAFLTVMGWYAFNEVEE